MRIQRLVLMGTALVFASGSLLLTAVPTADAIPVFSRKYGTSCATCHVAFPKLNAFGEAFRNNGYRMPGGDDQYEADDPVKLGAEPWKRLWPEAIWPGSMPYLPPVSLLIDNEYMVEPGADVNNDFQFPSNVALLTGGTFGDTISFFGRINLVAPGEDLHVHRLFGQLDGLFGTRMLNVRFGQLEPRAVPFSSNRRLTRYDYLMNTQTFPLGELMEALEEMEGNSGEEAYGEEGHNDAAQAHLHGGDFALGSTQQGVELWGVATGFGGRGGLEYGFGVVNGNGSGDFETNATNDNNSSKDIFWRGAYKFGGLSVLGDTTSAPAQANNWRDNSLRLGFFGYRGSTPYVLTHEDDHGGDGHESHGESFITSSLDDEMHGEVRLELADPDEVYTRLGADVNFWIGDLNLFGAYMWGETRMDPLLEHSAKADFNTWFTEADYVVFPWLVGALRYERVNLPGPLGDDLERWVPHVTALVRANAKFDFDAVLYPTSERRNRYLFTITFAF